MLDGESLEAFSLPEGVRAWLPDDFWEVKRLSFCSDLKLTFIWRGKDVVEVITFDGEYSGYILLPKNATEQNAKEKIREFLKEHKDVEVDTYLSPAHMRLRREVSRANEKAGDEKKKRESAEALLAMSQGDVEISEEALSKVVTTGIRNAIQMHGPIDMNLVGSAAKRVVGELKGYLKRETNVRDADDD